MTAAHQVLVFVLRHSDDLPEDICRMLALKPGSVGNALRRAGRSDLARPYWRLRRPRVTLPGAVVLAGWPDRRLVDVQAWGRAMAHPVLFDLAGCAW